MGHQSRLVAGLGRNPRWHRARVIMFSGNILIFCCVLTERVVSAATTYDQRQTGQLNVQVDLKDLEIIAVLKGNKEEYVDYDYAYDYSEMTIKPHNGTTPRPLNGTSTTMDDTVKENSTFATSGLADQATAPTTQHNTQTVADTDTLLQINDVITTSRYPENDTTIKSGLIESTIKYNETVTNVRCKKGFIKNHKGGCELKLQNSGNALLKLVRLSQKLKQRRENRSPIKPFCC